MLRRGCIYPALFRFDLSLAGWYTGVLRCVSATSLHIRCSKRRTFVRVSLAIPILVLLLLSGSCVDAQSPNASIRGIVLDPDAKRIPGAEIIVVNDDTGVKYMTSTNGDGFYVVENLPPGPYRIQVSKFGFKGIIKPDIVLNVQDGLSLNFTLPIGASAVTVTVEGGAPMINTQDASVSTVVDRNFVANMPLNGRSFQSLILLTPGVVSNSPQTTGTVGGNGEFSVNGQRTEANYYSVDGVSANTGVFPGIPQFPSTSGSLPASTTLGTTQGLVSVDALQEFRVQSSTYSAEYGRNPGGQLSFVTRSGTNQWHGTAFDYLRSGAFDANDWFNNYLQVAQPALRQNDFGGTLGGPVVIPAMYDGKEKTFFFFSYEGLRLLQPQEATTSYVPDADLRKNTPAPLQQVMNAFPVANGPAVLDANGAPIGLAEFQAAWSNPSNIDSFSFRIDESLRRNAKLFFRFGETRSRSQSRSGGLTDVPSIVSSSAMTGRTFTGGLSNLLGQKVNNDLRINYSSNQSSVSNSLDSFGGAQSVDLAKLQGISAQPGYLVLFGLFFGDYSPEFDVHSQSGVQTQWNVVDTATILHANHQFKFGIDYRRLAPVVSPYTPAIQYYFYSASSIEANSVDDGISESNSKAHPIYHNFSAFAQDEWRVTRRVNLSLGLRWEVNPAPSDGTGNLPYTVEGGSLATLQLAPRGTPLWNTTWFNFAPRLGAAFQLRTTPGWETVLRGGGGVFYDTGQQNGSWGYNGPGFQAYNFFGAFEGSSASFPIPSADVGPPIANPPVAPYGTSYAFPRHFQLPYTLQWNASLEQALGNTRSLALTYVGANGRRLLEQTQVRVGNVNPDFLYVDFFGNGLTASYNALQVKYQQRLARGLQVLSSYTFAHSIDYGSQNSALPYIRGNSDYDVRHSFSAAVSYELPGVATGKLLRALTRDWGIDDRFSARTAFPVNLLGNAYVDPATGQRVPSELDLVAGVPVYLYGPKYPGGREINPKAFHQAAPGGAGNAPRNFARGFGAWQMDVAIRRELPLYERLRLQFRAEAFNIFNHPNFGQINGSYCSASPTCTFGQATHTLASSLGVLSPLYQMGGPRSMQFAIKLLF